MTTPPWEPPDLLEPHRTKRPAWVRILCFVGAGVFFLLGVLGWLIPLVSGIPFYIVALVLLGMASDRVLAWINRLERKLPVGWRQALRRGLRKNPERAHPPALPPSGRRRRVSGRAPRPEDLVTARAVRHNLLPC